MLKLAFLASNRGSLLQPVTDAIAAGSLAAEVCLVVSNKETAPVLALAEVRGIRASIIPTLPDPVAADRILCESLQAAGAELVILWGYLRKLGPLTLQAFEGRILNSHPALLPKFGGQGMYGRRVHEAVAAAGEHESGITIHLVDGEYDHGRIVAQKIMPVPVGATAETVEKVVVTAEQPFFVETLIRLQRGDLKL